MQRWIVRFDLSSGESGSFGYAYPTREAAETAAAAHIQDEQTHLRKVQRDEWPGSSVSLCADGEDYYYIESVEVSPPLTCETCRHSAVCVEDGNRWCCVVPDGVDAEDIQVGHIGMANFLCEVVGNYCGAHASKAR